MYSRLLFVVPLLLIFGACTHTPPEQPEQTERASGNCVKPFLSKERCTVEQQRLLEDCVELVGADQKACEKDRKSALDKCGELPSEAGLVFCDDNACASRPCTPASPCNVGTVACMLGRECQPHYEGTICDVGITGNCTCTTVADPTTGNCQCKCN